MRRGIFLLWSLLLLLAPTLAPALAPALTPALAWAQSPSRPVVRIASTTSTENSGLLRYIQPMIESALAIQVRFIVTGTGKALRLGAHRDVDLLWVHDDFGEQAFMRAGHGSRREKIMYNRFVLIGPQHNPALVTEQDSILQALAKIQHRRTPFVSRGDDSGTHRRERKLWQQVGAPPFAAPFDHRWYLEVGSGMGATLNIAAAMHAYTISDEATWTKFANRHDLRLLLRDDSRLFNPYSVIVVAKTESKETTAQAERIVDWLISPQAQAAINAYRINGQQVFFGLRRGGE